MNETDFERAIPTPMAFTKAAAPLDIPGAGRGVRARMVP